MQVLPLMLVTAADVVVFVGVEVVVIGWLVVVTGTLVVEIVVVGTIVVVGGAGAVPRLGVAAQVLTCRPAVKLTSPSGPSGSENPAGKVPTYALKL